MRDNGHNKDHLKTTERGRQSIKVYKNSQRKSLVSSILLQPSDVYMAMF